MVDVATGGMVGSDGVSPNNSHASSWLDCVDSFQSEGCGALIGMGSLTLSLQKTCFPKNLPKNLLTAPDVASIAIPIRGVKSHSLTGICVLSVSRDPPLAYTIRGMFNVEQGVFNDWVISE